MSNEAAGPARGRAARLAGRWPIVAALGAVGCGVSTIVAADWGVEAAVGGQRASAEATPPTQGVAAGAAEPSSPSSPAAGGSRALVGATVAGSYRLGPPTLAQDRCQGRCPQLTGGMQWRVEAVDGGFRVVGSEGSSFTGTTSSLGLSFGSTMQNAPMSGCSQSLSAVTVTLRADGSVATGSYQTEQSQTCGGSVDVAQACACSYLMAGTFLEQGS